MTADSKLVEKLGFRVEAGNGMLAHVVAPETYWQENHTSIHAHGFDKHIILTLWKLCLELSERLALHEKEHKSLQDLAELQGVKPLTNPSALQMEGFDIEVPERKDA